MYRKKTEKGSIRRHWKPLVAGVGTVVIIFAHIATAGASTSNISHSYQAEGNISNGSIVSLDPKHSGSVQLANVDNGSLLVGVALPTKDSLLAVESTNSTGNTVQIATNGTVNTLVSTVNGGIKVGNRISASQFDGVGMKAGPGTYVVGVAQTAFNSDSTNITTESVKDKNGQTQQIKLGFIRLSIAIGSIKASVSGEVNTTSQTNFLQRFIQSQTGHSTSTIRILLSIVVIITSLVSLIALVAAVYASVISIGRNPLAKHAVFRMLTFVTVASLLTIVVTCAAIYYLLR